MKFDNKLLCCFMFLWAFAKNCLWHKRFLLSHFSYFLVFLSFHLLLIHSLCFTLFQVYYYYPFSSISDPVKLYNDLRWNITRPQGFEAVMRVRCSQVLLLEAKTCYDVILSMFRRCFMLGCLFCFHSCRALM